MMVPYFIYCPFFIYSGLHFLISGKVVVQSSVFRLFSERNTEVITFRINMNLVSSDQVQLLLPNKMMMVFIPM